MKKNRVDEILVNQTKRRKKITSYVLVIIAISIIFLSLLLISINENKAYYVSYNENSNIDYKVYLKENDFFDKHYLEKDNQYIASLIDYITAQFNYQLSMEDKSVDYDYSYRIDATVNVKEKSTNNSLYKYNEIILSERGYSSGGNSDINIRENIEINYNKYNDLIKKFVNVYELDDVESTLEIDMHINVTGKCEDFEEDSNNETVISLNIPLTTKTVAIDISSDLVDTEENIMACKKRTNLPYTLITLDVFLLLVDIILIVLVIRYAMKTRTAESIYDTELKKILNNYRSYIQKINNEFDLTRYQVLKVDTFTDLLEIRDTIQEPILMVENKQKTGVYFLVPSKTKILYSYGLKVSDIKKKLAEEIENIDL